MDNTKTIILDLMLHLEHLINVLSPQEGFVVTDGSKREAKDNAYRCLERASEYMAKNYPNVG